MTIDVFDPGLKYYVKRIKSGVPFTWIRLGDGEWSAILQDRARTNSRSQVLNILALKKMMSRVIIQAPLSNSYILSMRPGSQRGGIESWLVSNQPEYVNFHDCRVLYKASKKGNLYPWVRAIRESGLPVVIVGPKRHASLHHRMFEIERHIVIPNKDCFVKHQTYEQQVVGFGKAAVVLFSAGPAAKVMCHRLFSQVGKQMFLFDVGSLFDPYCQPMKISRQYHKTFRKHPHLINKNLTGE